MDINQVKALQSLDLESFEIRGAKAGVGNAKTTGPVYVSGTYYPASSRQSATGDFTASSPAITAISFNCNLLKIDDTITVGPDTFTIKSVDSSSSVTVDRPTGDNSNLAMTINMGQREYLVQPDIASNTVTTGDATFIQGSDIVNGSGTDWLTSLASGDFIQHDGLQQFFGIVTVIGNTQLQIDSQYPGDTTAGSYTAKKWIIGRTEIEYTKNDFTYDKNSAKWKPASITASGLSTSLFPLGLADGINLAFTSTLSTGAPDLMDSAVVLMKTFAQSTQTEAFQFSLPVVPNPESSMDLYINGLPKVINTDYVINYHQSPIYLPPPPMEKRQVANLMPLAKAENIEIPRSSSENGQIHFINAAGEPVSGVMPGTEVITVDSTSQVPFRDYAIDPFSGTAEIILGTVNEELVKYVAVNRTNLIDYGIKVYMNGIQQSVSYPPQDSDDVKVSESGRLLIKDKDHPGPGEEYEIHYQVAGSAVNNEAPTVLTDLQSRKYVQTSLYPLQNDSVLVAKNGILIDESVDYRVSYTTGRIVFLTTLDTSDQIRVTYTPMSLQVNGLTYEDSTSYCTVYDSRMIVKNVATFEFMLINSVLSAENLSILRIYNETRNKEYSLDSMKANGHSVILQANAENIAIGLASADVIITDYKFASESVEYQPIILNKLTIPEGSSSIYFSGMNVVSEFVVGSIVRLTQPDGALPYYFVVISVEYDGEGTLVTFGSAVIEDMPNPFIAVTDDAVIFNQILYTAQTIVSGSSDVFFPGVRIKNLFRPGTLLKPGSEIYQVENAGYDEIRLGTTIRISGKFLKDYINPTIYASDNPVYAEGSTELIPFMNIVDTMSQPGLILSGDVDMTIQTDGTALSFVSDASTYQFWYSDNTKCIDMATAIQTVLPAITAVTYVSQWDSTKIIPGQNLPISDDFPASVTVQTALRLDGSDTTNFSASTSGGITLMNGLVKGQRYNLDYMGRRYLGDSTVIYSANYFTLLPKKSKVQASFKFDNLDQFYIQVMSQRDFLDNVTIPRMTEEARQLNGNPGQGGEVSGDEAQGNEQGGITNDEYRRQDAEVECNVFKQIYDWFSNRLNAFGTEMSAATGLNLFNNDGIFNVVEQQAATLSFNRIFPYQDYTNFEPYRANPLTGEYTSYGAVFTQGSNIVNNIGASFGYPSYWSTQLKANDFIHKADSTKMYKIQTVNSDIQLTLTSNYAERSTYLPVFFFGTADTKFVASSGYPIYDDDGNLGAKIVGTRSDGFNLAVGDVFDYYIDGTSYDYKFYQVAPPTDPFMALIFPPDNLSADSVAKMISNPAAGMVAKAEWVFDPYTTYGFKTAIILRTVSPVVGIKLGTGSAITKLGFTPGAEDYGNLAPLKNNPEIVITADEMGHLAAEIPALNSLIAAGITNKLLRAVPPAILSATTVYTNASDELTNIASELPKINQEVASTGLVIQEPSRPAYADTLIAYTNAVTMQTDTLVAQYYDSTLISDWQGRLDSTKWVLDLQRQDRYVRGKNTDGTGVSDSSGLGIVSINGETTFLIDSSSDYDRRIILGTTIDGTTYRPGIVYEDNLSNVDGSWSGGDPLAGNRYTLKSNATFTFNDSTPVFTIMSDGTVITDRSYLVDRTGINIFWIDDTTSMSQTFRYADYITIGSMKTSIGSITGFDTTGNSSFDSCNSESFRLSSGLIDPYVDIYPALRSCYVTWQTISDQMLTDRVNFATDRSSLIQARNSYLINTRQPQIMSHVVDEGILRDSSGGPGDLYTWANNRWNRRQGCEAKLKQIEKQIEANQSALAINISISA
jgi:hypothetical protein